MRFWIGFGLRIFFGAWVGLGLVWFVCMRASNRCGAVRCGVAYSLTHSLTREGWMGR